MVAASISKCEALGDMLGLGPVSVENIRQMCKDPVEVNMKILGTWMQEQTVKPTTWRSLLKALQEMNMNKLVCEITEKLKRRPRSH